MARPRSTTAGSRAVPVTVALGLLLTLGLAWVAHAQTAVVREARLDVDAAVIADAIDERLAASEEHLWIAAAAVRQGIDDRLLSLLLSDETLADRHDGHLVVLYAEAGDGAGSAQPALRTSVVNPPDAVPPGAVDELLRRPESVRAAVTARDTGLDTATRPILVDGQGEPSLVLMVPVYEGGLPLATPPERRRAFIGVMAAVLDTDVLFSDVAPTVQSLSIGVDDIGPVVVERVDAQAATDPVQIWRDGPPDVAAPTGTRDLVAGDRRWRLTVSIPPPGLPVMTLVVLLAGALLTLAAATVLRVTGSARDSAERLVEQRTAELVAANAALKETDRLKSRFLTTVSHELRTPLTSVLGFTVTLRRLDLSQASPAVSHFLERIEANARSLHRMIEELLDFGRFERIGLEVDRVTLELAPQLRLIAGSLADELDGRPVQLSLESDVWVEADVHALQRIVGNLLHNAARYAPAPAAIELSLETVDGHACIEVRDEGPGFGVDAEHDLFERFTRGDDASTGGTGIGLAVVLELARAHGGDAALGDRTEGGAWVRVRLPLTVTDTSTEVRPVRSRA